MTADTTVKRFWRGQLVTVDLDFANPAGTAIDPTAVFCKYENPAGTLVTLTYGTDAALVKDATGDYHVNIDTGGASATVVGTWTVLGYSTGTGQAAVQSIFEVADTI